MTTFCADGKSLTRKKYSGASVNLDEWNYIYKITWGCPFVFAFPFDRLAATRVDAYQAGREMWYLNFPLGWPIITPKTFHFLNLSHRVDIRKGFPLDTNVVVFGQLKSDTCQSLPKQPFYIQTPLNAVRVECDSYCLYLQKTRCNVIKASYEEFDEEYGNKTTSTNTTNGNESTSSNSIGDPSPDTEPAASTD
jgi:hypothetical protein